MNVENPSEELQTLASYVRRVYVIVWCSIKAASMCFNGWRHFFQSSHSTRFLQGKERQIVDNVICRNAYYTHPENILLAMLTDVRSRFRELALRRILKARSQSKKSKQHNIRQRRVSTTNLTAEYYIGLSLECVWKNGSSTNKSHYWRRHSILPKI